MPEQLLIPNSGIQTIIPQLAVPQYVYLDFDGAVTSYHNRDLDIFIDNIEVEESGFDNSIISLIVAALNAQFDDDIVFTADIPQSDEYSIVYIGTTHAFDVYGSFLGLAETIDSGNNIRNDNAFVFLNSAAAPESVISVIAHETKHIVRGMEHGGDDLEKYAVTSVVGAGQTVTGRTISAGTSYHVYGVMDRATVYNDGELYISSGGTANRTTLLSESSNGWGGRMYVLYGGVANRTTINSDGMMDVDSGGTANNTMVNGGGELYVDSGGTALNINWTPCVGTVYIDDGAYATFTSPLKGYYYGCDDVLLYNGMSMNNQVISSGIMYVFKEGVVNRATVDGTTLVVSSGGVVNKATLINHTYVEVSSGGTLNSTTMNDGELFVVGGMANNTRVNSGFMLVISGGTALNIDWTPCFGYVEVYAGGYATFTSKYEGCYYRNDNGLIVSGMTMNNKVVKDIMYVFDSGVANRITVSGDHFMSGGLLEIKSGGIANSTTVDGYMNVYNGGVANSTITNAFLAIYEGGVVNSTTVNAIGNLHILFSGTANSTTIESDGTMAITDAYGVANNTIINHGGAMTVYNGGTANSTKVDGGLLHIGNSGIANMIELNGYFNGCKPCNTGSAVIGNVYVSGNGIVNHVTVNQYGHLSVSSGGKLKGTVQLNTSGGVSLDYGAIVDFTVAEQTNRNTALVNRFDYLGDTYNVTFTLTVKDNQAAGQYVLANYAQNFNSTVSVRSASGNSLGNLYLGGSVYKGNMAYSLSRNSAGTLLLNIGVVDLTAPTITNVKASTTAPTNGSVTVSATFADETELAQSQYRIGSGTWKAYTGPVTMTDNGIVYFKAVDASGNTATAQYEVTNIDKTAPSKPTASASTTSPTNQDVTVTATFSSDTKTKQYSTDNKTWKTYTSGIVMSANGTVYFRGLDAAGNVSAVTSYAVTNIDKTAPSKPTASASTTSPTNQNVTVMATFSSDTKTKQYSTDSQTWKTYTSGIVMSANGTVYFRGLDAAGNVSAVTSYAVTNIDKTAPSKPTATASTTAPTNQDVTVTATFSSDTTTKQYSTDSQTWKTYTSGIVMSANGTVYFRGLDASGNVSPVASYSVTNIDKTAPSKPTATASTTAPTNQNVTVTATFSSDTKTKQYSMDNQTWKTYTSGVVMSSNGTVYFRGLDASGNVSPVASYSVTNIDKTAPSKPTATASTTVLTNQDVTVMATFSTDTVTKQYSTDSRTWKTYTSGVVMSTNGTAYFRGLDAAGNISEVTSHEVTNIDKAAPAKVTGLAASTSNNTVCFSWQATADNLSGVADYEMELSTDTGFETILDRQSGAELLGFSRIFIQSGTYYYRVRATDKLGNASAWSVSSVDFEYTKVLGTEGDDIFNLSPADKWGSNHIACWNGTEDEIRIRGRNRYYDAIDGRGGYDIIQLAPGNNAWFYADLLSPHAANADSQALLTGISEIRGNGGNDIIDLTTAEFSYLSDILLQGGSGNDHLWAGDGNDALIGGAGNDDLRGGRGDDIYLFGTGWGRDTVTDDGGTLVFDSALQGKLAVSTSGVGTVISDGQNTVSLNWQVEPGDLVFAEVAELQGYMMDAIKAFLA